MFDSVDDLSARLAATGYFIDPVMTQVVFLAARLQKPLLLEGPAGSGKTQLAISVAAAANTHVERLQCYCGVTEDKAIGRFDEGLQRLYMEFSKGQNEDWRSVQMNLKGRDFFRPGPLMRASAFARGVQELARRWGTLRGSCRTPWRANPVMRWLLPVLLIVTTVASGQADPRPAADYVHQYAVYYGVPPELISALIDVESRWNPRAVSNKGAMGLMQLMPQTAKRFGAFRPFDIEQNIAAGTRYVTSLMWEFHGDHIKNLPVGQMEILMVDSREGTRHSHLHVRRAPRFELEGMKPSFYPRMHSYLDPKIGVNLRFREVENRKQRRRRTAGLFFGEEGE